MTVYGGNDMGEKEISEKMQNIMKRMIFFDVCIFSSVAAPTKINATLTKRQ